MEDLKDSPELKKMGEELKSVLAKSTELLERHDKEKAELGAAIGDTKDQVSKFVTDMGEKVDKYNAAVQKLQADFKAGSLGKARGKSFGQKALDAIGYDGITKDGSFNQMINKEYKLSNGMTFAKSADLVSDVEDSAEQIVSQTRDPNIYFEPQRQLSMRNLIPVIPIAGGVLEIMRETYFGEPDESPGREGKDGNAGTQFPQLSDKNQSQLNFELLKIAPDTVANWILVSRQALRDQAALRAHINNRLLYSVQNELDRKILNGSGIDQMEGINTVAPGFTPEPGSNVIDVVRRAMGDLAANDYPATAIVLNHIDWTNIETLKVGADDNRYVLGDPNSRLQPRMWGLPVVPNNNQPEGVCLVGNFALGSQLRPVTGTAQLRMTDSHEGNFIKNGIVILAEEDMILGNQLPNAYRSFEFPEIGS